MAEAETTEKIEPRIIDEEMKQSYLDYSMSVIVGRALPDIRDGLKPVHRRVLYTMNRASLFHNKPFRKSAFVVGRCLSDFHPHGDVAIYDSLVRMAQDFSLRYPLINGQGNFGSIDGDRPAAMRYTEAKLQKLAEEMLQDIDKETVKFIPNFDNTLKEPTVLPSKVPNLLVNGSSGIAVGMATNIPPHNLSEIADGMIKFIDNPEISTDSLIETIHGPDFPTGALILGTEGIKDMYRTGRGRILIRAKTEIEEVKNKKRIIVTEIPYMVNKSQLIEQIADLVKQKKLSGISDLRDESDRNGIRIVIELRQDANPEVVVNQLHKHSRLQTTFGAILIALVDNQPKLLKLKDMISEYIKHRQLIVRKRTEFDLKNAEQKAHILEGLLIALKNLDKTIKLIKESKSVQDAKKALISELSISEQQATSILDMRLQRITSMEQDKIKKEHAELLKLIEKLKSILASEQKILQIIKEELLELKKKYSNERRTQIAAAEQTFEMEDLIEKEDMVITISHEGYIKRISVDQYKRQRRGGKGIIAAKTKDEDFVEDLFIANTHSYILFFTNNGKVHWKKVYHIPEGSRIAKGKPIVNLLSLEKEEKVTAFVPVKEFKEGDYLFLATRKGTVKKTPLQLFANPRKGGIIAINLETDDELIEAKLTNGKEEIILATRLGMAARFNEQNVRPTGRTSMGVFGIRLKNKDDFVVGMVISEKDKTLFTVTENGFGKRTLIDKYRLINRGGLGVINIKCTERNGNVVSIKSVEDNDELMLISKNGIAIRTPVKDISLIGRNTQGVRLMKLNEKDKVVAAARIVKEE